MKALLVIAMILVGAIGSVQAQKKNTLMGDILIGELAAKDEATGEITIKYPGKEGTEIFSGFLVKDYKLRMEDGMPGAFKLNEIATGAHIRVFYKSGNEKVSGQEKKVNKISRLDFLGKDKFFRLRNHLNIDPSAAVALAEKDELPVASPLKVHLAIAYASVHEELVEWIDKWNRKNGDQYGKLEPVSGLEQADISIVVARGADTSVMALPVLNPEGRGVVGQWTHGTSYLVAKDPGGLKILWTSTAVVFSSPSRESSPRTNESVTGELEKRMKARARSSKK